MSAKRRLKGKESTGRSIIEESRGLLHSYIRIIARFL
jgi:hypothetical protein